ncbi:MAG: peptidase domain-containing ABC transporter [bacterium]|nr:peptidase domain-containing ABC transporter [bacterium]
MKKFECVLQDDVKDCGAACLLTIIKTYGGNVSLEYLKTLTNTTNKGTNAYYLFDAAKDIGFDTRAVKGDVLDLDKKILPCIAHVIVDQRYKHFVVIHEISKQYITLADPAYGIKKIKIEEFNKISTNQFLLFVPNKKIPYIKDNKEFFKMLISNLSTNKNVIISIFIFSLIFTILNIFTSYSFQFIIEDSINLSSKNNLYFIVTFLIVFTIIKNFTNYFRFKLLNYINCKLDYILMSSTFKHIILLPYQYYKNKSTGDIISRINDLSTIKESISNIFMYLFVDSILVVFVLFSLFKINIMLSFISLIIVVFYVITIKLFSSFLSDSIYESKRQASLVNLKLVESIEAVESIKGLSLENEFSDEFNDTYSKYINNNKKFFNIFNTENLIKDFIDGLGINIIMFIGAYMVLKGNMTIGSLITYNSLVIYFLEPLKNIINSDLQIKRSKISLKRIKDLYNISREEHSVDKKYTNNLIKGNININNLSYSYGKNKILKNINLDIDCGEKILLCGNSGSGKSTLSKIIMKYYNVENNILKIDCKDINDYNLMEIRRDICYVSQNEKIFTDSIYNNVILNRNINYDSFLKVCDIVGISKIVGDNILKYDMLLEENGFNISGGERQRIILARSLLKKSSIYIFDECLSQLDIKSEREILTKIFTYLEGKTIIFISHRFNNSDMFDKVIYLNNGVLDAKNS